MYCIVCGTKNPEYGKYCYNCGTRLVAPPLEPNVQAVAAPTEADRPAVVAADQLFSISAEDLADVNPFLFKDDEVVLDQLQAPPAPPQTSSNNYPYSFQNTEGKHTAAQSGALATTLPPVPPGSGIPQLVPPVAKAHPTANPYAQVSNSTNSVPNLPALPPLPGNSSGPQPVNQPMPTAGTNPYNYNPYSGRPTPANSNPFTGSQQPNPGSNPFTGSQQPNLYNNAQQPPYQYNVAQSGPNANFVPQPLRPLIAPNGLPYTVVDHPNSYYKYKTKEGKQVYAAYSEVWQRLLSAAVDTILVLIPFVAFMFIYALLLGNAELQKWIDASNAGDVATADLYLPHWITMLLYLGYLAYTTLLTAKGQTLGKRLLRLKVITLAGPAPDLRTSFLRNLFGFAFVLGSYIIYYQNPFTSLLGDSLEILTGIGFAMILFDPRRQGWHDKLAGTLVVKSKELVEGVDFPAKGQL